MYTLPRCQEYKIYYLAAGQHYLNYNSELIHSPSQAITPYPKLLFRSIFVEADTPIYHDELCALKMSSGGKLVGSLSPPYLRFEHMLRSMSPKWRDTMSSTCSRVTSCRGPTLQSSKHICSSNVTFLQDSKDCHVRIRSCSRYICNEARRQTRQQCPTNNVRRFFACWNVLSYIPRSAQYSRVTFFPIVPSIVCMWVLNRYDALMLVRIKHAPLQINCTKGSYHHGRTCQVV